MRIILSFILSTYLFAADRTALFANASWDVLGVHGPIKIKMPGMPERTLNKIEKDRAKLEVGEFLQILKFHGSQGVMTLKRFCASEDHYSSWTGVNTFQGGKLTTTIHESAGGVFKGQHKSQRQGMTITTTFTISPIGDLPQKPVEDDIPADTPKELGEGALAYKLSKLFPGDANSFAKYISSNGDGRGKLVVKVWLGAGNKILNADRNVTDPCDPRFGKIEPAAKLLTFNISYDKDARGEYYFVQSNLIDVETGVIEKSFAPDFGETSDNLTMEVSESFDGLGISLKQ